MAEAFIDGLPRVDLASLPNESTCMICLIPYGNDTENSSTLETAVRLPCGHHIGADCIHTWLSPNKAAKNSCPYCRTEFWELESNDESDDEDAWYGTANPFSRAEPLEIFESAIHFIAKDGQPPREGQQVP